MSAATAKSSAALDAVVAGVWRDPENRARDVYRHPSQTLAFFGVAPQQTVIEITPGSGWYSEIMAPYLHENGQYIAAVVDPTTGPSDLKAKANLEAKFTAAPEQYAHARVVAFDPKAPQFGAAGSADVVLTFRNVHNWRSQGNAEAMFKGFFDVLKPGGTLGVVEHRAKRDVPADDQTGYVGQQQVIAMALATGFVLAGKSELNANPKDTTAHPNGVWTLPPVNRHDPEDNTKYAAIGESDRMTLRFLKPAK
ncbi:MAG: methyltransferase [Luteimonas sp.]